MRRGVLNGPLQLSMQGLLIILRYEAQPGIGELQDIAVPVSFFYRRQQQRAFVAMLRTYTPVGLADRQHFLCCRNAVSIAGANENSKYPSDNAVSNFGKKLHPFI